RRQMTVLTTQELSPVKPEKRLRECMKGTGGRNNQGRLSGRHHGGGHKRLYLLIDFKREKAGIPARVRTIEYDPNRSARVALLHYADGDKRYILAPEGLRVGDRLQSGADVEVRVGNALPLSQIPTGTLVHNVELKPGRGGQLIRSAGASAQVMGREGLYGPLRRKSGETRKGPATRQATAATVAATYHE